MLTLLLLLQGSVPLGPNVALGSDTAAVSIPRIEVEGLTLCGARTLSGPGGSSEMRSGIVAAAAVLDRDLLGSVLSGGVLGDRSLLPVLSHEWDPWRESH